MTKKNKLPTIISFILDRSGSMESIRKNVIGGFNEYINGLKKSKEKKNILFSLTTFDTMGIEKPYVAEPILKVEPLNNHNYVPRAGTPLYDAAVNTIEALADKVEKGQPVLVVIMTDGEENSSVEHNQSCFKDLVEQLKVRGNWTFVFMGANQDAWANAASFGMDMGNTMEWKSTLAGTQKAFRGLTQASVNYVAMMASADDKAQLNTSQFFNKGGEK